MEERVQTRIYNKIIIEMFRRISNEIFLDVQADFRMGKPMTDEFLS